MTSSGDAIKCSPVGTNIQRVAFVLSPNFENNIFRSSASFLALITLNTGADTLPIFLVATLSVKNGTASVVALGFCCFHRCTTLLSVSTLTYCSAALICSRSVSFQINLWWRLIRKPGHAVISV